MIPVKWPGLKAGMYPAVGPQPVVMTDGDSKAAAAAAPPPPRDESLSPQRRSPKPEDRGRSTARKKLNGRESNNRSFSDPSGRRAWPPSTVDQERRASPERPDFERSYTVQDLVRTFEDWSGKKKPSKHTGGGKGGGYINSSSHWRRPCNQYGEGLPLYEAMLSELREVVGDPQQAQPAEEAKMADETSPVRSIMAPSSSSSLEGGLSYQQNPCYPVLMNELEGILEEWDSSLAVQQEEEVIKNAEPMPRLNWVVLTGTALLVPRPFLGPYTQMQLGRRFSSQKHSRRTWRPYDKSLASC